MGSYLKGSSYGGLGKYIIVIHRKDCRNYADVKNEKTKKQINPAMNSEISQFLWNNVINTTTWLHMFWECQNVYTSDFSLVNILSLYL